MAVVATLAATLVAVGPGSGSPAFAADGINPPVVTLRSTDGAVLPESVRVPAGSAFSFDAVITNDEPTRTTIRSVDLFVDGRRLVWPVACSAPTYCPASVVVREVWGSTVTGLHELRVVATDEWDLEAVATVHVDVYPGTYILPCYRCSEVSLGKSVSLTAKLVRYDSGLGEPGRKVTVQWQPVGAGSWQTLATPTTSSTGRFAVLHAPHRNGSYRLTYAGLPDAVGGAVTTVSAVVHPQVKAKPRHRQFEHGHLARIDARTSKAEPGAVWYLQRFRERDTTWVNIAKRHIHASRHATLAVRVHRAGSLKRLRIMRPATARYGAAADKFIVHVG